jgi:hypothetical protein
MLFLFAPEVCRHEGRGLAPCLVQVLPAAAAVCSLCMTMLMYCCVWDVVVCCGFIAFDVVQGANCCQLVF